jgi:hypothetical protein
LDISMGLKSFHRDMSAGSRSNGEFLTRNNCWRAVQKPSVSVASNDLYEWMFPGNSSNGPIQRRGDH